MVVAFDGTGGGSQGVHYYCSLSFDSLCVLTGPFLCYYSAARCYTSLDAHTQARYYQQAAVS